jgi:hypothetical protein
LQTSRVKQEGGSKGRLLPLFFALRLPAGRQGLFFCDFLLLVQKKVTKEKDSLGFSTTH